MKSNLLKVFCGMIFAVLTQANVEGMNNAAAPAVAPAPVAAMTAQQIQDSMSGHKGRREVVSLVHSLQHSVIFDNNVINIKLDIVDRMRRGISSFAGHHPNEVLNYPNIFGNGPNSLLFLLANQYDPNTGRFSITKDQVTNIVSEFARIYGNIDVNQSIAIYYQVKEDN